MDGGRLANGAASERKARILGRLRELGHVSVSGLSEEFGVTEMTIRRDLRQLTNDGLAVLVHGGARMPAGEVPLAFQARAVDHAVAKRRIGRRVARQIGKVGVLGIDAGTTALEVAVQLPGDYSGVVVTHSVPALAALASKRAAQTVGIGGTLIQATQSLVSDATRDDLAKLPMDVFVLGANALDADGVYAHTAFEVGVKRAFIDAADRVCLVIDASKVGNRGEVLICPLDQVDEIVTDRPLPTDLQAVAKAAGVTVTVC